MDFGSDLLASDCKIVDEKFHLVEFVNFVNDLVSENKWDLNSEI